MSRESTPAGDHGSGDVTEGAEFAWKVHQAQDSWTAKVDTKASIFLALEVAVLGTLLALHSPDQVLDQLDGWRTTLDLIGMGLHLIGLLIAVAAVIPMLGRAQKLREDASDNMIFFGHLRLWKQNELASRLKSLRLDEEIEQLSRQMIAMSNINWRKHRRLQAAISLALVGSGAIGLAVVWP